MPLPLVHLWTDGSGTTRTNPGGWACVLICGERRRELYGGALDTTNNRMELTALLKGLEALTRPCQVVVHSDSEYVIKPHTQGWLGRWQAKNWKGVKNPDLFQAIIRAKKVHDIRFEWVKGHSDVADNERCDRLAGDCRRKIMECEGDLEKIAALDFEIVDMPEGKQMELIG